MFRLRIKELRERESLSQRSFAEVIGVAASTVGMWESGKREPNFQTVNHLADYFGVTVDYLVGAEQQKKPTTVSDDELDREIAELITGLSAEKIKDAKNYLRFLKSQEDNL